MKLDELRAAANRVLTILPSDSFDRDALALAEFVRELRVDPDRLIHAILPYAWQQECRIVTDYMPPFPGKDTRPTIQVWWQHPSNKERRSGLRFSHGPRQGYFWDGYGEDMYSVETALLALSRAPDPNGKHWDYDVSTRRPTPHASLIRSSAEALVERESVSASQAVHLGSRPAGEEGK